MVLSVDIGNSNIKMALFKGERILCNWRLPADKNRSSNQYKTILKQSFKAVKSRPIEIEAILVCSVVPQLTAVFKEALSAIFKKQALILGQDFIAPIKNLYKKPKQVGQDRLANAVAATNIYAAPVIVVDFGTALTFDLVTGAGNYLGGVIVPGIDISLKALIKSAALLPDISLSKPGPLLGRETAASMKSGLVYGYSFLVEAMLQELKKKTKQKPYVVATGGEACLIRRYCKAIDSIDENLTLRGLLIAFRRQKQAKKRKKKQK